ncbi:MAG: thioredoxin family protein [Candidatus Woesearchaeota archaeon]|jgi:peroxiredoxin|nr:thioredoxin family protein [Candidatus Woesearchaeota archaeon]|tara:strand:+ start:166 stop:705 length:540 start_codon:yes stop_codon:yes gene_type:complete
MMESVEYKLKIGDSCPGFDLPGTDGKMYKLEDFHADILAVFFTCNHCPYAIAVEPRINEVAKNFTNISVVGINSNNSSEYPEDSFDAMVKRVKEKDLHFLYLHDESQLVAKDFGGQCTPHFFIFDKERKLRYQGRFDDNWQDPGNVAKEDFKDAILAIQEDKEIPEPVTPAMGCSIKWK